MKCTFYIIHLVQQQQYDKRNKNYCTRTRLEMDGEKKCCKWCGFGLLFVLDPIAKISFFLFVYGRWVGFWHSRYRRTHIIFFGIKRKAISSMWSETFGFIHRMHGIFTIRWACACVFFCRYFCLLAPISFFSHHQVDGTWKCSECSRLR